MSARWAQALASAVCGHWGEQAGKAGPGLWRELLVTVGSHLLCCTQFSPQPTRGLKPWKRNLGHQARVLCSLRANVRAGKQGHLWRDVALRTPTGAKLLARGTAVCWDGRPPSEPRGRAANSTRAHAVRWPPSPAGSSRPPLTCGSPNTHVADCPSLGGGLFQPL